MSKKKNKVMKAIEKVNDVLTGKAKAKQELINIKAQLFDIRTTKERLSAEYNRLTQIEKTLVLEANKKINIIEGKQVNDSQKKKNTPKDKSK